MKRIFVAMLLASLAACGGGGSDPVAPPQNTTAPPKIESGLFTVTANVVFNECERSTVWDGTYQVDIDSTSFSMGVWDGTWNAAKRMAAGETEHVKSTTRYCTVSTWTSINITFTSKNVFSGSIIYRLRLAGDCNDRTTCTTSWRVVGVRQ